MKALITGVNGFVGEYLASELINNGDDVYGSVIVGKTKNKEIREYHLDITDAEEVCSLIENLQPDHIYHLAGQSNVGLSWKDPLLTFQVNVMGTLNLLEAVRSCSAHTRILIIGSSDQYGIVSPDMCPISEDIPLNPKSPYAQSKMLQEQLCRFYTQTYFLNIIMVRAFNHIGPGQNPGFVVSDFASRIVNIEYGLSDKLTVGNLDAARDFSDVRDIVRGYRLLMKKGTVGEIYNIGSGYARKISDVLDVLLSFAKKEIDIVKNPDLMRPSDAPIIYGDCTKILKDVGYKPQFQLEETLKEVLDDWRLRIKASECEKQ